MYYKISKFLIFLIIAFSWQNNRIANALEENSKFCIRTEPLLLTDIEKHVNPIEDDPLCEILATTLTAKEKESFTNTMCKDYGKTTHDDFYYLKLHNGKLTGRASYKDICSGKVHPYLAWVPLEMIQLSYVHELSSQDGVSYEYIAKATDVQREKTELCHFRHSDLVSNISKNLFTCVVMIFEDNFFGADSNVNVLVEIEPLMYLISNITYLPWVNVSSNYKTVIGRSTLKNANNERTQIYGSLNYAFVEKVRLNLSSVYNDGLPKLPILFEHKGTVLELDRYGIGGIEVKEKAYFGRAMDAKTAVDLEVIGEWSEHRQQFNAEIFQYFGYGIKRYSTELHSAHVAFVRIDITEPVYMDLDTSVLTKNSVHTITKANQTTQRVTAVKNIEKASAAEWDTEMEHSTDGHPYPGLYPWFVGSALIVGGLIIIILINMIRTCSKERHEHKEYKVTGM